MRVYVSHPYGGQAENLARVKRWLRFLHAIHPEWTLVCSWVAWAEAGLYHLDEPAALRACMEEVRSCQGLVSVGVDGQTKMTPGMANERGCASVRDKKLFAEWRIEP
jgi:hypothetical protein